MRSISSASSSTSSVKPELQGAAVHVIDDAPRRADDHVHAARRH
jgi:hypothetical protein